MAERIQFIGERMQMGAGYDEMLDSFGPGVTQMVGETMDLSKGNRPIGQFSDQSMGEMQDQTMGTVPLKRAPHRGYESGSLPGDSTPISKQTMTPDTNQSY